MTQSANQKGVEANLASVVLTTKKATSDRMNFSWSTASDQQPSRLTVAVNGDIRCYRRVSPLLVLERRLNLKLTGISGRHDCRRFWRGRHSLLPSAGRGPGP